MSRANSVTMIVISAILVCHAMPMAQSWTQSTIHVKASLDPNIQNISAGSDITVCYELYSTIDQKIPSIEDEKAQNIKIEAKLADFLAPPRSNLEPAPCGNSRYPFANGPLDCSHNATGARAIEKELDMGYKDGWLIFDCNNLRPNESLKFKYRTHVLDNLSSKEPYDCSGQIEKKKCERCCDEIKPEIYKVYIDERAEDIRKEDNSAVPEINISWSMDADKKLCEPKDNKCRVFTGTNISFICRGIDNLSGLNISLFVQRRNIDSSKFKIEDNYIYYSLDNLKDKDYKNKMQNVSLKVEGVFKGTHIKDNSTTFIFEIEDDISTYHQKKFVWLALLLITIIPIIPAVMRPRWFLGKWWAYIPTAGSILWLGVAGLLYLKDNSKYQDLYFFEAITFLVVYTAIAGYAAHKNYKTNYWEWVILGSIMGVLMIFLHIALPSIIELHQALYLVAVLITLIGMIYIVNCIAKKSSNIDSDSLKNLRNEMPIICTLLIAFWLYVFYNLNVPSLNYKLEPTGLFNMFLIEAVPIGAVALSKFHPEMIPEIIDWIRSKL